jgi:NOL1/NOP2/fmu family ribosome biogenesis protein
MSTIQCNSIPKIHVDLNQALQYLRRETPMVDTVSSGWALITYKDISLGWVKQVQGKAKNHYPLNWRILMRG